MVTDKINVGDVVLCDMCNADHTIKSEQGGIMFGSKAVCPKCAPDIEKAAIKYNETDYITARCPKDKTFAQWVREDLRNGRPATIEISTW